MAVVWKPVYAQPMRRQTIDRRSLDRRAVATEVQKPTSSNSTTRIFGAPAGAWACGGQEGVDSWTVARIFPNDRLDGSGNGRSIESPSVGTADTQPASLQCIAKGGERVPRKTSTATGLYRQAIVDPPSKKALPPVLCRRSGVEDQQALAN
jgi:hypothetical protein